jgi:hypothetical protein
LKKEEEAKAALLKAVSTSPSTTAVASQQIDQLEVLDGEEVMSVSPS